MGDGIYTYFKNLSPSKVNGFLDYRAKWFLTDIMKRRLPATPEMERGKAVENGITAHLGNGVSVEGAIDWALQTYDEGTADLDIDEAAEARIAIPSLVETGIKALEQYGKLISVQRKVIGQMDGIGLDWLGYADLEFEGGIVVDMKVTGKTPSVMSGGHSRQGAFYHKFIPGCQRVDFVYLIPLKKETKAHIITVQDVDKHIHDLKMGALAMHKILSVSDKPDDLKEFFHPAPGEWWMKDELAATLASEVWGISHFAEAV